MTDFRAGATGQEGSAEMVKDLVERLRTSCDVREAALLRNLAADALEAKDREIAARRELLRERDEIMQANRELNAGLMKEAVRCDELQARLEAAERNKKQFERDWLEACDAQSKLQSQLAEAIVLIEISLSEDYDGADVEAAREWLAKQEDKP